MGRTKCTVCERQIKLGQGRKLTVKQFNFFKNKTKHILSEGMVCNPCRMSFYSANRQLKLPHNNLQATVCDSIDDRDSDEAVNVNSAGRVDHVVIPVKSTGYSHSMCVVCRVRNKPFVCIGAAARLEVFISQGVLLSEGSRCCKRHMVGKTLRRSELIDTSNLNNRSILHVSGVTHLLNELRKYAASSQQNRLSFDDLHGYSDDDLYNMTGLTKHQFEGLVGMVSSLKQSKLRSPRLAIGVLLLKLRTGLSQRYAFITLAHVRIKYP